MQNDEELEKLGELWLQALKKVNHTKGQENANTTNTTPKREEPRSNPKISGISPISNQRAFSTSTFGGITGYGISSPSAEQSKSPSSNQAGDTGQSRSAILGEEASRGMQRARRLHGLLGSKIPRLSPLERQESFQRWENLKHVQTQSKTLQDYAIKAYQQIQAQIYTSPHKEQNLNITDEIPQTKSQTKPHKSKSKDKPKGKER
ncbi:MAG: hypothetical protein MSA68_00010 [Helicobacter sp.]|nr:hypothetical protein [Helicobacter sp.]